MTPEQIDHLKNIYISTEAPKLWQMLEDKLSQEDFHTKQGDLLVVTLEDLPGPDKYWPEIRDCVYRYFRDNGWAYVDVYRQESNSMAGRWMFTLELSRNVPKMKRKKTWLIVIAISILFMIWPFIAFVIWILNLIFMF